LRTINNLFRQINSISKSIECSSHDNVNTYNDKFFQIRAYCNNMLTNVKKQKKIHICLANQNLKINAYHRNKHILNICKITCCTGIVLYIPRKIRTASRPARMKIRIISAARASLSYMNETPANTP